MVEFPTSDLRVAVHADQAAYFNQSDPNNTGFVDFMAFQPENAVIRYNDDIQQVSAFYEYLVTDALVIYSNMEERG